ncbi:unnamed protein product [Rotaria magnacalcarata]
MGPKKLQNSISYSNTANYSESYSTNPSLYDDNQRQLVQHNSPGQTRTLTEYQSVGAHNSRIQQQTTDVVQTQRHDKTRMECDNVDQELQSWHYTSTSGAKSLDKITDAHYYIKSMSEIWQVPNTTQGDAFINDLNQAIDDGKHTYWREYFFRDDQEMIIHIMVAIRSQRGQMREIYHCLQQVTNSFGCNTGGKGTPLNIKPGMKWLRTKAEESLKIHAGALNNSPSLRLGKYDDGQHGNISDTDMQSTASSNSSCRMS